MAHRWSKILSYHFVLGSLRRQGFVRSMQAGFKLVRVRSYHAFFKTRLGRAVNVLLNVQLTDKRTMYAFYDLAKVANGFDFFNFLVLAELYRLKHGYREMHIVIVFPHQGKYKLYQDYKALGLTDFYARLQNIVIPGSHLLSSCCGITVCISRQEANEICDSAGAAIFPVGYTVRAPIAYVRPSYIREAVDRGEVIPSLEVPYLMRNAVQQWLGTVTGDQKIVTITLRESNYAQEKNSNLEDWIVFARHLQDSGRYTPVFIRDTEQIIEEVPDSLKNFVICHDASLSILFRAGLYEASYLNLFVNNGPTVLSILNKKSRYILFKFMNAANVKATPEFLKENHGFDYGASFPGATPWQKIVWEDDTLEVIEREFNAMCEVIERSS